MKSLTTIFVLGALSLYVAAYYLMLNGRTIKVDFEKGICEAEQPNYRCGGPVAVAVFVPICAIDRMIRPNKWAGEAPLPQALLDNPPIDDTETKSN